MGDEAKTDKAPLAWCHRASSSYLQDAHPSAAVEVFMESEGGFGPSRETPGRVLLVQESIVAVAKWSKVGIHLPMFRAIDDSASVSMKGENKKRLKICVWYGGLGQQEELAELWKLSSPVGVVPES